MVVLLGDTSRARLSVPFPLLDAQDVHKVRGCAWCGPVNHGLAYSIYVLPLRRAGPWPRLMLMIGWSGMS